MIDPGVVKALLAAGNQADIYPIEHSDMGQKNLLHLAAECGNLAMVQALIDGGATVDLINDEGTTALFFAAHHGHANVVKALLNAGADKSITKPCNSKLAFLLCCCPCMICCMPKMVCAACGCQTALRAAASSKGCQGYDEVAALLQ